MARRGFGAGFTLVEATVAVAIIAIVIVAIGSVLTRLPAGSRVVRDEDLALKIARAKIEDLRAGGYSALPASGPFTSPLLNSLTSGAGSVTIAAMSSTTKQISAQVSWRENGTPESVSLVTLMAQNSGLP